jgi:uncharacterized protein (DUF1330 family)
MSKPAYFIFDAVVHDLEAMQPYMQQVEATYQPFGGQLLVRGGSLEIIEGQGPQGQLVILQFPSLEAAHAWHASAEYQSILPYRLTAATSHAWLAEGLALDTHTR